MEFSLSSWTSIFFCSLLVLRRQKTEVVRIVDIFTFIRMYTGLDNSRLTVVRMNNNTIINK